MAGADEGDVGELTGQPHHLRASTPDRDGYRPNGADHPPGIDGDRLAVQVDFFTAQQCGDGADRFAQREHRAFVTHAELFQPGAHTDTEEGPSVGGVLQRRHDARQDGGMA